MLFRRDLQLAAYSVFAGHRDRFGFHSLLLSYRSHWSFQNDIPVLRNNLHVVCVGRKGSVLQNGPSNLLAHRSIGGVLLLLIGSRLGFAPITVIDSCVVWSILPGCTGILPPGRAQTT